MDKLKDEDNLMIAINVKKLRELKEAVDVFSKNRRLNDLSEVGNKLANIYSELFGCDCAVKITMREPQ